MHLVSSPLAIMDFLGGGEIVLIFVVVLIFFGGDKLPEFARGFGKVMKEFKKAASEVEKEFKNAMDEADQVKANAAKAVKPDFGLETPVKTILPPVNPPSVYTPSPMAPATPPVHRPPEDDASAHIDA
jgi:TatA/E family protein of Tat protein translocase